MARPIWSGTLSFGLLNIPVSLMAGERRTDLSFRMLDSRNNARVRYERVNADTGDEVPWKDIVKAYEYDKDSYVVLEPEDIQAAAPESRDSIDVDTFVDACDISPQYFEKPYVLVPAKKAEKGYVLLREALTRTGKAGIARVVIRTREHLCAVMPRGEALLLIMMRFPQELVDISEYTLPEADAKGFRITDKEQAFSEQLIETMAAPWDPSQYTDDFRERLQMVIRKRMEANGVVEKQEDAESPVGENAATNVVDFMELLQQSIDRNRRTPARKAAATKAPAKKAAAEPAPKKAPRKAATKKTAAKKAPAKKSAARKRA
ncbi:Ku protein [Luteimonas yindakuii]|uniref:Non-homologous end joining protein Ku n=1 Tax=Luteimonas yindakuii TaxID=2565782 RepID=A0A4Z1RAA4_9GAMM|nr:Ku protein [Luteimonas yindakuii]TKS53103.1 Ku protein [Luteimonas yindakuii]